MKNQIIFLTVISFFLTSQVMAEQNVVTNSKVNTRVQIKKEIRNEVLPTKKAERQEVKTNLKKDLALKEIERRVSSLSNLVKKITTAKKLSEVQKNSLTAQAEVEIGNLSVLKEKISTETDLVKLTEYKKQIVNSYRVYAFFMPKITILMHANSIASVIDLMISKTTDSNLLTKLNDNKLMTQSVINNLVSLDISGYPGNKSALQDAKNKLEAIRLNINNIRPLMK